MAVQYQTLVQDVRDMVGLADVEVASRAGQATLGALTQVLGEQDRRRVTEVLPGTLASAVGDGEGVRRTESPAAFVRDVAERCGCTPEEARLRAQATLSVLCEQEPDVFRSLDLPAGFDELLVRPRPGGGVVGATGKTAPLSPDEVDAALAGLRGWSGDTHAITRTVSMPAANLDRVLPHLQRVLQESGHGGDVRRDGDTLTLELRTRSVDAVTRLDVDTARSLEDVLEEMGPVIASPHPEGTTPPGTWSRTPNVLFSGIGLRGWRMCGPGGFDIVDGVLQSRGGMGVLWYAERAFTDFTLTLDWRVGRAEDNSGVHMRFPALEEDPWVAVKEGYEIQLHDAGTGEEGTAAVYQVTAPHSEPPVNPPGEWNHLEVQVRNQSYRVGVNGREVTALRGNRRLAGYIGLQNHDDASRVQFRNVYVFEE